MDSRGNKMAVHTERHYKLRSRICGGDSLNDGCSHNVWKASFCCQNWFSVTTTWAPFLQLLFGLFWELCSPLLVTCAAG